MANETVNRFFGGQPLAVIGRLILLSILIGFVLNAFGSRSAQHHQQHPPADRLCLESRLRRHPLAVALFPARRRDRDPDLADHARGQRPARALTFRI